ncbi:hypothetical protein [Bradyrhizobium sp. YR681]|uniref:hypothetical protein n=1 Tax=Bradyrhizobium sp. YR681 TaxID=1144344 RepID=UPI0012F688CC|nr:hypothetical protein [Bradyrhizobium sp. YR681]
MVASVLERAIADAAAWLPDALWRSAAISGDRSLGKSDDVTRRLTRRAKQWHYAKIPKYLLTLDPTARVAAGRVRINKFLENYVTPVGNRC